MTAQPTTRISTPLPPHEVAGDPQPPLPPMPQSYGDPQSYGAQPPSFPPPAPQAPYYPPLPPAPKRSAGKVVGIVIAVLVLLGGLGAAALFVFGQRTVEPESVQQEIVRITQTAVGVVPADVRCPDKIEAQAGGTFACTATVDGQPVTYDVRQDDDQGHLTINYDRLLKVDEVESVVAQQVGSDVEVAVNVDCPPAGRTVVVNAPGTPIACTATNATDPSDSAAINVTVAADGTPSYTFA
jgi:Domain of unknown function (DUF4333)